MFRGFKQIGNNKKIFITIDRYISSKESYYLI